MPGQEATSREQFATALRAQRWRVLAALAETATLDADPILRDGESLDCEAYTTLLYEFHRVHLPELAAAGLVRFDRRRDELTRGPRFDEIRPLLDRVDDNR